MGKTKIEWTDFVFNPWLGCTKVSPGCDRCYAEALMDTRYGRVKWGPHGERVRTSEGNWYGPRRWAAKASREQAAWEQPRERPARPRVFCASLADVFDNQAPQEWRNDLWWLTDETPELDWLLLTKRPENIFKMVPPNWRVRFPRNIWIGFTAEDQARFDQRWPVIRDIPAVVRFCSYEPAIGPLRLPLTSEARTGLGWVICGGESGPGHRPMEPEWERNVRLDCEQTEIPYFFKQMAGKKPVPEGFPVVRQFPQPIS